MTGHDAQSNEGHKSKKLGVAKRRPIPRSAEDFVDVGDASHAGALPGLVTPIVAGVSLAGWIVECRHRVFAELARRGALLFRGFRVDTADAVAAVASACTTASLMS